MPSLVFLSRQSWRAPVLAAALILLAAAGRVAFLTCDCPLDLAPDEAHYWDWSRHLDWSYYSKGPLVAYLIRCSTTVFGTTMPAVRLPAVLCGSLLLASLYVLTVQVWNDRRLGLGVVALALTLPPISAGATLMTIDSPYTCCWGWALVLGHRAVVSGSRWAWPLCGVVVGLGILAKYTMLLWLGSFALFLAATPACRRLLWQPRFGALCTLAGLACVPVLIWNLQHDWISLRHVAGQTGLQRQAVRWTGPVSFLAVQFVLLLGLWFVAWVAGLIRYRPVTGCEIGPRYLWWMSVPTFAVFLGASLKTAGEPNWPAAAYLSGLVLAVAWLAEQFRGPSAACRRSVGAGLATACGLGLLLNLAVHRAEWVRPWLLPFAGQVAESNPLPARRIDPTCRLRGWRFLAREVDRLRDELGQQGQEPILAGAAWTIPGELAFYCRGNPPVYSLGRAAGDRHSQYDLWRPNPLADAEDFAGRTMIVIGEISPTLRQAFERVDPPRVLLFAENGLGIARWTVTVCRGFRAVSACPAAGY